MFYYDQIMNQTYFDWAATAPIAPDIAEQMLQDQLSYYGNPSSQHSSGRAAAEYLRQSRDRCAEALRVSAGSLYFTSGGTESDTLPLLSLLRRKNRGRLILTMLEHSAIYELTPTFHELGFEVKYLYPDQRGIIPPDKVEDLLTEDTVAIAAMLVNNETGAIQPVQEMFQRVRRYEKQHNLKIHLHCDAVQALGKIPLDIEALGADSTALSAHKIGGPRGIGLLHLASTFPVLSQGGGQEGGMRPGTENVAAAAAFASAIEKSLASLSENLSHVRRLEELLLHEIESMEGCRSVPVGRSAFRGNFSPYILPISVAPIPGEVLTRVMSDRGFEIGTGSACSSKQKKKKLRVPRSMGLSEEEADGIVRISFGPTTSTEELKRFTDAFRREVLNLRKTVRHKL